MSAPQYAIVAAVEEQPQSPARISERTGMTMITLDSALARLLQVGLIVEISDGYIVNSAFSSTHSRLNLSSAMEGERPGESVILRDVIEDRSYLIQALLVRYLKRKNACAVGELLALGEGADKALLVLVDKEYCSMQGDTVTYIP
jgi:hypothetical protein